MASFFTPSFPNSNAGSCNDAGFGGGGGGATSGSGVGTAMYTSLQGYTYPDDNNGGCGGVYFRFYYA